MKRVAPGELEPVRHDPVDAETLAGAGAIVDAVRQGGEATLREYGERYGDLAPGVAMVLDKSRLAAAWREVGADSRGVLERASERVRLFAMAHREALPDWQVPIPGGTAGTHMAPVEHAGCYAPGGRYPLPSSVIMTAVTARAAGVADVTVASPKPSVHTLAAAHIAGADRVLAVGGAQAIAALAYGVAVPRADAIVGPGNRWVTAAKQRVAGRVQIDGLAGPSELLVIADSSADPGRVAADLLAQAEHDPDALPVLVCTEPGLADAVDAAVAEQLETLPTREVAEAALANGYTVETDAAGAIALADRLAPEHLALHVRDLALFQDKLKHYGALFVGEHAAEVLGDYGAGPNHVLPTGGAAKAFGALSVLTFLRAQTWLKIDDLAAARGMAEDSAKLARMEGLEAHARAAEHRLKG